MSPEPLRAPHGGRHRPPTELLEAARTGDRGAIGRLLSLVEQGGNPARQVDELTFASAVGAGQVVGVTGAPGSGKSTLVDRVIEAARAGGETVGVLAIDPSSPFSGGAILGDRIRMQGHTLDRGVFIRSMATRGHQGGLTLATPQAIRVLAAVGIQRILVETVGVGQVEVEIAGMADTTVVVVTPGWGDAIQASKAGLLEVADIFVVNKADQDGAAQTRRDLENMMDLIPAPAGWRPPIVLTSAASGDGVEHLWVAVHEHRGYLESSGELARRREARLVEEMNRELVQLLQGQLDVLDGGERLQAIKAEMLAGGLEPYRAASRLLEGLD